MKTWVNPKRHLPRLNPKRIRKHPQSVRQSGALCLGCLSERLFNLGRAFFVPGAIATAPMPPSFVSRWFSVSQNKVILTFDDNPPTSDKILIRLDRNLRIAAVRSV